MTYIDRGDVNGSKFIDFRKALDLIDHKILIKICQRIFSSSSKAYIESRQETVESDRGMFTFAGIRFGVPQGSIL